MKLYFLRHGVAFEREQWHGDDDELRPLTEEGILAMHRVAHSLRQFGLKVDLILTSPLVRARQTAKIVAEALDMDIGQERALRPGFDLTTLADMLRQYGDAKRIMLVGHEPDLSQTIGQLINGGAVEMRKGGLARVDIIEEEPLRGELVWLLPPEILGA